MTNRQPIDPASLVEGAKVTIEGTVCSCDEYGLASIKIGLDGVILMHSDNPAILSVTPPPTDWSKVKRARNVPSGAAYPLLAVSGNKGWFQGAGEKGFIDYLEFYTPLPDEPSAGEAKPAPAFNDPRALSQQEPDMSVHLQNAAPDTRPAWQRAKVGDVVSVRAKVERIGYPEDHPEFRLNFGGCKIIAAGSDILEIVRQADEKC